VAAFDGMAWMQRAVRGVVVQNKPVEWVVPSTGFPVRQEYFEMNRRQIKTLLAGSVVQPSVYDATDRVNRIKQANAIAPNFVHSLDAAALMLTVVDAAAEGIEQFSMIHDSYGTVPSDCDLLARCCRQSFAKLYMQHDVIADLYSQLAAQYTDPMQCPEPPVKGDLDVSRVLASEYFFA
jgi:Autographiviridae RNA polymerase